MKTFAAVLAVGAALASAANNTCIDTCMKSTADALDCDVTDISGCVCQASFTTDTKKCFHETDGCSDYVTAWYDDYNDDCSGLSAASGTATASSATATSSSDCYNTCYADSGSSLGCDYTDLSGCFCNDDFRLPRSASTPLTAVATTFPPTTPPGTIPVPTSAPSLPSSLHRSLLPSLRPVPPLLRLLLP